jgi:biopolymer transport protein ExbD
MAKRHKKARIAEGVEVDLTPMIDVTFQLIIFFMLVTTITTQENVNLRLPDALVANPEDPQAKKAFTVHIAPRNQSSDEALPGPNDFGYFCYGHPQDKTLQEMGNIMLKEAELVDPARELKGYVDGISENEVVIRCDARAPAQYFGALIELMATEVKMYRIKIAILKDPMAGG